MRLASFRIGERPSFGIVTDRGVVDAGSRLGSRYPDLKSVLADSALDELAALAGEAPDHPTDAVSFLPVIPNPGKILCAGINYRSHAAETGRDLPENPSMFARFADTLLGHGGTMIRPKVSERFDFEGELALVIGRGGRHIAEDRALDHVAGYTCFVDGSVRDYQRISVTSGKNFPATGPLGPWLVTADEIPDPARLTLTTRLNGAEMQRATTDLLIYSVPRIIAWCSQFTPLGAGDVIATGTPEGVGHRRTPPVWMKAGDALEVEISGIGVLRAAAAAPP